MTTNNAGLYLHIPFCASKCRYCDFYSFFAHENEMDAYVQALLQNMQQWRTTQSFDTVYLGGGTPSLMGGTRLLAVLEGVRAGFLLTDDAEITVECNPDSMDETLLDVLRAAGVNRLSIGVQSAHDDELARLGRRHSFAQAKQAVQLAQKKGFDNISLDLMYGLPQQTQQKFLQSVEALLALNPQHLSCYGLKLEHGTPLALENPTLPDEDVQANTYLALCDRLSQAGFFHYEISNWAKDEKISRHNAKYWDFTPYLGIGAGAHSLWQGKRFAYARSVNDFLHGKHPENEENTENFPLYAEYVMLALRTAYGVSRTQYEQRFAMSFDAIETRLQALKPHGLTAQIADGWRLTEQGFLISNAIINDVLSVFEL